MLRISKSTISNANNGVFANQDILVGTILCEYEGERTAAINDTTDHSRTYNITEDEVIIGNADGFGPNVNDAIQFRPLSRDETARFFENHEIPTYYDYNCEYKVYDKFGKKVVVIIAIRDIHKDEELFVSYGFKYWASRILRNGFIDRSYPVTYFRF